jgi:hypothetical protein
MKDIMTSVLGTGLAMCVIMPHIFGWRETWKSVKSFFSDNANDW